MYQLGSRSHANPRTCPLTLSSLPIQTDLVAAQPPKPNRSGRRLGWLPSGLIFAGLLLAGISGGFVVTKQNPPDQVASGSMAPALYGLGYQVECDCCQFSFRCGIELPPPDKHVVCPNCGFQQNQLSDVQSGQTVRVIPNHRAPRRFEIVAARLSPKPATGSAPGTGKRIVKRVVGLPGELVSLRDGELYVDDRLVEKSLSTMAAMAILVNDDRYRSDGRSRWAASTTASRWRTTSRPSEEKDVDRRDSDSDWHFDLPQPQQDREVESSTWDWLSYHHSPGLPPPFVRHTAGPIMDNYAYNQGAARQLNVVRDILVSYQMTALAVGSPLDLQSGWAIQICRPDTTCQFVFSAGEPLVRCLVDGQLTATAPVPPDLALADQSRSLTCGTWDRRWICAVDGHVLLSVAMAETAVAEARPAPGLPPFSIGVRGDAGLYLNRLQVWRDIYYTHPMGRGDWTAPRALRDNEYLLLGDNSPSSHDGRWFPAGIVNGRDIEGTVVRVNGSR